MLKYEFAERNVSYIWNMGLAYYSIASIFIVWSSWVDLNGFLKKSVFFCQVFLLVLFTPSFFSGDLIKSFGKSTYFRNSFDVNR